MIAEVPGIVAPGTQSHLDAFLTWPEDITFARTGLMSLLAAVAHQREHLGHAELTRDLWLAAHP
jgi:hypothetical protein